MILNVLRSRRAVVAFVIALIALVLASSCLVVSFLTLD